MVQWGDFQMNFSKDEETAILEMANLHTTDLIEQIKNISLSAWDNRLEVLTLKNWLNNFTGECFGNRTAEQNLALWLVQHFVFYTDHDIRALSVNLWWKFIHQIIEEYNSIDFLSEKTLDEKYDYIINNTVIQPLGNCGESGTNICYFFRQSNALSKEMFSINKEGDYKYLVLVDDATVSGYQAKENLEKYKGIENKKKYILTYISTEKAQKQIGDAACVISSIVLDEKSKCFSPNSYLFSTHNNWISAAKKLCRYYGAKIDPRNPLGYRRGQYLFGFYYNTPNNSLPIIWGTLGGWIPLFNRFFSNLDNLGGASSDKFV